MNKAFKIIIIACTLIIVLSISSSLIYYYGFFKPKNETAKWEAELELEKRELEWEKEKIKREELIKSFEEIEKREKEKSKEQALLECLDSAYKTYIKQWNKECELLGLEPGSPLPYDKAEYLDEFHKNLEENCFKIYGFD